MSTYVDESTLLLLGHLHENTIDERLIVEFTKLQDECDDLTDKFSRIQKSAAANRPIHTMGIYNVNDSQQIVNRTIDDFPDEQHIICSNSGPVVFDNEPNTQQQ